MYCGTGRYPAACPAPFGRPPFRSSGVRFVGKGHLADDLGVRLLRVGGRAVQGQFGGVRQESFALCPAQDQPDGGGGADTYGIIAYGGQLDPKEVQ